MARRIRHTKMVTASSLKIPQQPPQVSQETPLEEEPMHRYVHTIPATLPNHIPVAKVTGLGATHQTYIEEALMRQNQLLLDILSAINGLTAAMLKGRNLE